APGTGKTILAEQLAFANATAEDPALYLSTLSEPLEKIIVHGQQQRFFDIAKVGSAVLYEDLGLMLRNSDLQQLPELVTNLLTEHRPRFVFIDSFKALTELLTTPQQRRTLIYDLSSVLSSYNCTSFLIGEYAELSMTELPEFAIADVVVQLMKHSTNIREQRFLRVEKIRGSRSLSGMHAFSITDNGIDVYPRLLTPPISPSYTARVERVSTGITNLDEMVAEGFWRGSTTLVAGPTGSGKTILGLHFMTEGVKHGEAGVYLAFQENPIQLARMMQNLGWDLNALRKNHLFDLLYKSPVELQLDTVTCELFQRVREGKVKRVVIDALGDLERSSIDRQRFADFIYAMTQWFAVENVTCLLLYELTDLFQVTGISDQEVSNMADNIILLRLRPDVEMHRTLRIIKTRGSAHDNHEHVLEITDKGVTVKKA
ncbi:MAG TPA: ATPase domain-containing protein, partial [Pyrinomonadaceae bacterium]|nr:ATPase domain-containing protein [Pyrinomonadaceae bacterium]